MHNRTLSLFSDITVIMAGPNNPNVLAASAACVARLFVGGICDVDTTNFVKSCVEIEIKIPKVMSSSQTSHQKERISTTLRRLFRIDFS